MSTTRPFHRAVRIMAAAVAAGLLAAAAARAAAPSAGAMPRVDAQYPGLASGILQSARLADLPEKVLLRRGELEIDAARIQAVLDKAEPAIRAQLEKNLIFLLEDEAARRILLEEARSADPKAAGLPEAEVLQAHLEKIAAAAKVAEPEIQAFYDGHKEMMGGAPFEQVREPIRALLLDQKRSTAVDDHIRSAGSRREIRVNAKWFAAQSRRARDNPVDRARMSGKPTLVEFGATGCVPCDMMQPILDNLRRSFGERLNVVFVHVQQEQILGARFGIRSIPVQVFFDAKGEEVFRHEGFFAEADVRRQLGQMGVQ